MGRNSNRNQAAATRTTQTTSDEPEFSPDPVEQYDQLHVDADQIEDVAEHTPETSEQSSEAAAPDKPKRKRGPNKPKVNPFAVVAEASLSQVQIVEMLTAHAEKFLGKETAASMELQFMEEGQWKPIGDVAGAVRFATKGHK